MISILHLSHIHRLHLIRCTLLVFHKLVLLHEFPHWGISIKFNKIKIEIKSNQTFNLNENRQVTEEEKSNGIREKTVARLMKWNKINIFNFLLALRLHNFTLC